jgi:hypothetical protein
MLLRSIVRALLASAVVVSLGTACSPSSSVRAEGVTKDQNPVVNCSGLYGTTPSADGTYYATAFGCYVDAQGQAHGDPGDNCIPACLSTAQKTLCAGMDGPACEQSVNWYSADSGRYGCMTRLQVTNPANGKSVVLVALDAGPSCSVERSVDHALIDMSPPANLYLFGSEQGYSDKALVDVVVVPSSTPLGPVSGVTSSSSSGTTTTTTTSSSSGAGTGGSATTGTGGSPAGTGGSATGGGGTGGSPGTGGGTGGGGIACGGDGDCNPGNDGSGLICVNGTCTPGCHTDAQCPGSTSCVSGQCQ